jgi:hypothetical protein
MVNKNNADLRAFFAPVISQHQSMFRKILRAKLIALCLFASVVAHAQSADDAMRVTLALNPDGTKTTYETNAANHRCVATTTDAHGKTRGKIIYRLDADGRYESGDVFAANGAFRFHTLYHYNAAGQLAEETQLDKGGAVLHKIVYSFDAEGHPSGYAIYDGSGALLGHTTPKNLAPTPAAHR